MKSYVVRQGGFRGCKLNAIIDLEPSDGDPLVKAGVLQPHADAVVERSRRQLQHEQFRFANEVRNTAEEDAIGRAGRILAEEVRKSLVRQVSEQLLAGLDPRIVKALAGQPAQARPAPAPGRSNFATVHWRDGQWQ